MTTFFDWAIANAACAIVLAIPAFASSYLRRPAVTHGLWLLVLLRLVAPPMWHVPVTATAPAEIADSTESALAGRAAEPALTEGDSLVWGDDLPVVEDLAAVTTAAPVDVVPASWDWRILALSCWASGSVVCLFLAVTRIGTFRRMLRLTRVAPSDWCAAAESIALKMKLRRTPTIRLTGGRITPLLWAGFGRPVLLLPADFSARLDGDRRSALIAHELAHYRRGDHLVRWLELVVTALFWWHPVVWLARRELREAEEQLCDAWVVWTLPEARRAYAAALVDTVDFLHESRTATPVLASGLGEVRNLQRRIVMIMNERVPRRLTRLTMVFGLTAGLFLLALAPGRADDEPQQPPRPPSAPRAPTPPRPPEPPEPPRGERGREERRVEPKHAEEAEQIRSEMRRMRDTLSRLENRLAEIEGRGAPRAEARGRGDRRPEGTPGPDAPPARRGDGPGPGGPAAGGPGGRGLGGGMAPGGLGSGGGGGMGMPGMGGGPDLMRRLEEMQRNMEEMRREMSELRRMMRGGPGGTPVPSSNPGGERRERRGDGPTPPAPPTPSPSRPIETGAR